MQLFNYTLKAKYVVNSFYKNQMCSCNYHIKEVTNFTFEFDRINIMRDVIWCKRYFSLCVHPCVYFDNHDACGIYLDNNNKWKESITDTLLQTQLLFSFLALPKGVIIYQWFMFSPWTKTGGMEFWRMELSSKELQ